MYFFISNKLLILHFKSNEDKKGIKKLKVRIDSLDNSHSHMQVCFTPNSL